MKDAARRLAILALVVIAGTVAFTGVRSQLGGFGLIEFARGADAPAPREGRPEPYTPATGPAVPADSVALLQRFSEEYATLLEAVRPSVVSINTTRRDVVKRVYLHPLGGFLQRDEQTEEPGLGSGVIVSREGHVVTNYHVIEGLDDIDDEITVTTNDGSTFEAELVGYEVGIDIAVLRIRTTEEREFPALAFGDSSAVRVGETVFAVGNPFGLGETVTQGIISARPRRVKDTDYETFQTDTVINPGNSGGPLVNVRGEVIGINVALYAGQRGLQTWQGVSLAIPADDVKRTFESIMRHGRSLAGYLGVGVNDISALDKLRLGISDERGVLVSDIVPESPADQAGLRPGDLVLEFGGRPVHGTEEFFSLITNHPIDKPVEIGILRNGKVGTVEAVVAERSEFVENAREVDEREVAEKISDALGISVRDLSPYQRQRLGLHPNSPGIEITAIDPGSPLAGRLQPSDLIYQLNDLAIYTTAQFHAAIDQLPFDQPSTLYSFQNGRRIPIRFTPRRR